MDRDCHWCTRGSIRRGRDGSILGLRRCQELALEFGSTNGLCQGMLFPFLRKPLSRSLLDLGTVQGYALVEYETREEAEKAIAQAPQEPLLEQQLSCDFAFVRPPVGAKEPAVSSRPAAGGGAGGGRGRSASPARKPLVTRID